jgi:hypothetical protein
VAFAAQEHEMSPAKMGFAPIATNDLPQGVQGLAAGGFARKLQHQLLCIRPTDHFKPNGSVPNFSWMTTYLPLYVTVVITPQII